MISSLANNNAAMVQWFKVRQKVERIIRTSENPECGIIVMELGRYITIMVVHGTVYEHEYRTWWKLHYFLTCYNIFPFWTVIEVWSVWTDVVVPISYRIKFFSFFSFYEWWFGLEKEIEVKWESFLFGLMMGSSGGKALVAVHKAASDVVERMDVNVTR